MTRNSNVFLDWVRHKFSFGFKKKHAGATVEKDYFQYETFKFNQTKSKSSDDLENCDYSQINNEDNRELYEQSREQVNGVEKLNDENSSPGKQNLERKISYKRNSGAFKFRSEKKNPKKKECKNRNTVIPTVANSSEEKFATSPRENTFRRSVNRLRFSFVGTLRKKFHKDNSYNDDSQGSQMKESLRSEETSFDFVKAPHRSKRIMSAPSLKNISIKSDEMQNDSTSTRNSETSENLFQTSCNNVDRSISSSVPESCKTSKSGKFQAAKPEASPQNNCNSSHSNKTSGMENPGRNNTISLVKVSNFFSTTPSFLEIQPSVPTDPTTDPLSSINEYVKFNACLDKTFENIPQSPTHRNSDPYVNMKFHKFNLHRSQDSIKEDNYCLKFDDLTPAVPPKTYKKDIIRSTFARSTRSYQSFSSFSTLAVSSGNINKTIQQLPKSVAIKCEAFCKRVDAISTDYLPMNMHPLSNKLSIH